MAKISIDENVVAQLIDSQDKIFKKVDSIEVCLKGDEYHPEGGLVNIVNQNSHCIIKMKRKQNKFFAVIGGAWTVFTIGLSLLISKL